MTRPVEPAAPGVAGVGPLSGVRVVLGVSGGIAAYKAVEVCRRLIDLGAHVVPVLTGGALHFVGEATFSAVASERAHTSVFEDSDAIPHTRIGQEAQLVVVAPATARLIGSYAAGISADLLVATLLATRAPVLVCPAMHTEMWEHPAVQENLAVLRRRGVHVLEPGAGHLAGGDVGVGRMAEPADIVAEALSIVRATRLRATRQLDLEGRRVLVTAGGTREPIDPVRVIANRSSGKQGHAVAEAASARGAEVTLVTTVQLPTPAGADVVSVETAAEMAEAVLSRAGEQDLIVMAAAVADFRPSVTATSKLRKVAGVPEVVLEPTLDILAELGKAHRNGQVLVGFAAETESVVERATEKLVSKGADLVVANDVGRDGVGFSHDTNAVTIISADRRTDIPLTTKRAVADAVLDAAVALMEPIPAREDGENEMKELEQL